LIAGKLKRTGNKSCGEVTSRSYIEMTLDILKNSELKTVLSEIIKVEPFHESNQHSYQL
jgi:3-phosphoshikimate 1-carboxyvinyltransferase